MLFHHAKAPYENVLIEKQNWPQHKKTGQFEFEQIPQLEFDGNKLSQSKAILRYLGKQYGYYSQNPLTAWEQDSIVDEIDDFAAVAFKVRTEVDPAKQKLFFDGLSKEFFPMMCRAFNYRLDKNTSKLYLSGNSLSIADFAYAGRYFNFVEND